MTEPEPLSEYLMGSYRRDILGESVEVKVPERDEKLIAEVKARIARIDDLRLGASLVSRDFVKYQHRRALVALLKQLEARDAA